jgi:hypothetical protein
MHLHGSALDMCQGASVAVPRAEPERWPVLCLIVQRVGNSIAERPTSDNGTQIDP